MCYDEFLSTLESRSSVWRGDQPPASDNASYEDVICFSRNDERGSNGVRTLISLTQLGICYPSFVDRRELFLFGPPVVE